MPLSMTVESLDSVPAEHQELYKANENGGFTLDISDTSPAQNPPAPGPAPAQKPTIIQTVPESVKKQLEELDQLKAEKQAREDKKLADAGEFQKLKEQMEARHQEEINKLKGDYNKLQQEYHGGRVKQDATQAFLAAGGNPEMVDVILPHIIGQLKFENGATIAVDPQGNPVMTAEAGQSGFMGANELVGGLRNDNRFMPLFSGTKASGSGSGPAPQKTIGQVSKKSDLKSADDIAAYVDKHGEQAYLKLPA